MDLSKGVVNVAGRAQSINVGVVVGGDEVSNGGW